ncbi:ABC transporter permease/M1 family aminopeptidase [Maricaulis sp. D1M11]|uniref:ABC transporter permease/M1 family aminopeptidase n=1 Tax=Maricaulis sp. D1M11 TaxID=3076117 RepID=UPI0039B4E328
MLSKIAGFEIRYQLFSPVFIAVFAIFFLLVFAGVTIDQVQVGGGGSTNINSPNALTINVLIFSLFGGLIPAAFLSSGVLRDRSFKMEEIFFSRPIGKLGFVLGRFIGGFVATALCFASVPLAFLIGSQMPWLDQELIGPTNLNWYLYIYLVFGLVNMWVVGTILYAIASFTRSNLAVWIGFLGLIVLYLVGSTIAGQEPSLRDELALIDPFGFNTFSEVTRYWTAFEANTQVVPFESTFLMNRLMWIGIGSALLAITIMTFQFRKAGSGSSRKAGKAQQAKGPVSAISDIDLPRVQPMLNASTVRQQFFARTSFEVKGVVLNVAFWVILAFGLFNTVPGFFFASGLYGTDNYPVTRVMMNTVAGAYSIIPIIIVIYYAAELVWRERRFAFNEIVDATPTPSWVFVTSKFLGMMVVIVALAVVAIIAAILSQMIMGYTVFELDQYVLRGVLQIVFPAALLAALAIFLQVLFNNRWLGMAAMLVFFVVSLVISQIGFDHNLYQYGSTPGAPYSDMNGYGHFLGMLLWFNSYWAFWALLLMVLSYQLWSRGALTPIVQRLKALPASFSPATGGLALVSVVGAVLTGGVIFYNTNILNTYISGPEGRRMAAEYERLYVHLLDAPQPTITNTLYEVDIYPDERRYVAAGEYMLQNLTDEPLETVWISYGAGTTVVSQEIEGGELATSDERFRFYSFDLETAIQPGESRNFSFEVERSNPGFRNSGNVTTVNYNGTFFNNGESMPQIGFDAGRRLQDRAQRRRQGLEPIERAHDLEDEHRHYENGITNSHYVTFRTIVSTAADQIAIAPGYLQREWVEGDRRYFEYVMDRPILNFYSWLSAEYEVESREVDGINLQVFYHAPHHWNVERMLEASEDSLRYFSETLSPYQYRQFRVLEFPAYASFAQAFPNTIPYSEGIGFIGDLRDPDDIDYVYYVTAHEAAHQWWAHQVMSANVQGGTMLIETFAQYSALMVMRQEYGDDAMRRFLKWELDTYLGGRGSEAIEEQPLYRVENQAYIHYRKGAVIMYALQDYVGEETVNRAMRRLIDERAYSSEPYATTLDFLRILREEAGPEWEGMIHDFFERIVLFDLNVEDSEPAPTATELEDGRWEVSFTINAKKFWATGEGEQTEEPIDYLIDIGVFNRNLDGALEGSDHVLYLDKHRINEETMEFSFIVDERPAYVGIDPYNKLIDRNSDDNLVRVTID